MIQANPYQAVIVADNPNTDSCLAVRMGSGKKEFLFVDYGNIKGFPYFAAGQNPLGGIILVKGIVSNRDDNSNYPNQFVSVAEWTGYKVSLDDNADLSTIRTGNVLKITFPEIVDAGLLREVADLIITNALKAPYENLASQLLWVASHQQWGKYSGCKEIYVMAYCWKEALSDAFIGAEVEIVF